MKNYHHLSHEQRYLIAQLIRKGESQAQIARLIGRHKSTISRELKRNTPEAGPNAKIYTVDYAEWRIERRKQGHYPKCRFTLEMKTRLIPWVVEEKLSPELISKRGKEQLGDFVSHETIYKWMYKIRWSQRRGDAPFRCLYKSLKHAKRRRKRGNYHENRGCIPNRESISNRPEIVNKRKRVGDLESDLMLGKGAKSGLLVITDRATLYTQLAKINSKKAALIAAKMIGKLKSQKHWIKTITYDNDLCFAQHQTVNEALQTKSYFTRPYTSQDKGTVENRIGLLRMFFPKKTDFNKVHWKTIQKLENYVNNREVRKFNYQTPKQRLLEMLSGTKVSKSQ